MAERFAKDVAQHEMTVLHDDGLYRHLRFQGRVTLKDGRTSLTSIYWFDLITWPGSLAINGDMGSFQFSRTEDMFEFFRGQRINPQYWAQKVRAGRGDLEQYDEDLFRQLVTEHFVDAARNGGVPTGTGKAVREQILDSCDIFHEHGAHTALAEFEHEGFYFADTFEWNLRNWSCQFLWCCHAIQWGIRQYDAGRGASRRLTEAMELPA
jgi:hypothetical protein